MRCSLVIIHVLHEIIANGDDVVVWAERGYCRLGILL